MYTLAKSTRVCRVRHRSSLLKKKLKNHRGENAGKEIIVLMDTHYFTLDAIT